MIGLGSNRLSVCRRGGMRVTQAGKGGMEWLAGFRAPSWATPYSAQATAALKAQFPTQWPTIRDYGIAHPEIVGYMNAYAPEDAKIAYSLVEGIGTRYLDGKGGYIDTGINAGARYGFEFEANNKDVTLGSWITLVASRLDNFTLGAASQNSMYLRIYGPETSTRPSFTNYILSIVARQGVVKANGSQVGTWTRTNPLCQYSDQTVIFDNSAHSRRSKYGFKRLAFFDINDNKTEELVPYLKNGIYGVMDIITGTFHAGTGSFTESIETPAS